MGAGVEAPGIRSWGDGDERVSWIAPEGKRPGGGSCGDERAAGRAGEATSPENVLGTCHRPAAPPEPELPAGRSNGSSLGIRPNPSNRHDSGCAR